MLVRPATHAGSWYSADSASLHSQLSRLLAPHKPQKGARILIGPHAGYTYCAARLAEAYGAWDTTGTKRVFILGPSHHVYFSDAARVLHYAAYDTPLGVVPVDRTVCGALAALKAFEYMLADTDDDEHLFEMHAPFVALRSQDAPLAIVPIMISGLSARLREDVVEALLPYLQDEENTFVILLDFCHWGRRFGYTPFAAGECVGGVGKAGDPLHEQIAALDHAAMDVAAAGSAAAWDEYIRATGNTICGQKPVAVVLRLVEELRRRGGRTASDAVFEWAGYSQSNAVTRASDSSVSYASGYVRLRPL